MSNDELKKKIVDIIQSVKLCTNQANCDICKYDKEIESYTDMSCTTLRIADALIAAGIGDTEWQHDVFKKTYMDFIAKLHYDKKFFKRFDDVSLGCKLVMFEDILDQNKKEFV